MTAVPLRAKDGGPARRASAFVAAVTWNPIVTKELRTRMRGWHAFALLTGYLCVIGGLGWIVYDADIGSSGNIVGLGSTGAQVFRALAGVVMATVALVVPGLVGPTISGERERQTLDLLLVTPLGPGRIVLGKLIAALAFVVLLVIACLPLFSVAFLLGGVGIAEVLEVVTFTLVGAITIGALSMLISVLLRRVSSATVVSYLVMLALTVGPIAAGYLLNRALSEPAQNGPAPFSIAEVNGTTGIVEAVSPAVGAASLLDASDCGVVAPFFGSGVGVPIAVGCGPGGQYLVNMGPLGTWQAWESTFLLDGVIAVGALSASVLLLNRREVA
jgi:ABC-type transport system involved in multi-copper enzyme maturation permease subunit